MKREFLGDLRCLVCGKKDWELEKVFEDSLEIRKGGLRCRGCMKVYPIDEGVLNMLEDALPAEVAHEKNHAESFEYLVAEDGKKFPINRHTIQSHRHLFLSLPAGDGSHFFRPGGSFDNQAGNAGRFFQTLDRLNLNGQERVLELGASFTWASREFAKRGCRVVALDITRYLETADLYMQTDAIYYERVMADMSRLPFDDECFDMIFSHSVIHHCKDLAKLFSELRRVLKTGGRMVALHECSFGLLENKSGKALQQAIDDGFNENAYTVPQWEKGARRGGFRKIRLHFFSLIDSYVDRKKIRGAKRTFKLAAAEWLLKYPWIDRFLNWLSIAPRVLLRPKAWMLIAEK
jgi:SAM-dependent methyltransferase